MEKIVGVRFKKVGKIYYFMLGGLKPKKGDKVLVETSRGLEIGIVELIEIAKDMQPYPTSTVIRKVTEEDLIKHEKNKEKEKEAFNICLEKIAENRLEMKLVGCELTFDGSKILFYFIADGRVDFRQLVKDLAAIFRIRIELRQIGVRDEARLLSSMGMCGRVLCCSSFLHQFSPVSIKMAKDQGLSLNPTKISGVCGRLMCCLKYEEDHYTEVINRLPREGDIVKTSDGKGTVLSVDLFKEVLKVQIEAKSGEVPKILFFDNADVTVIGKTAYKNKNDHLNEELKLLED